MSITSHIFVRSCTASDTVRDKDLKIPAGIRVVRDIPYDAKGHLLDVSVTNGLCHILEDDAQQEADTTPTDDAVQTDDATRGIQSVNTIQKEPAAFLPEAAQIVRTNLPEKAAPLAVTLSCTQPSTALPDASSVRTLCTHPALPVIISIHGGGYVYGNKEVYQYYAANLAGNGFVVVNFNYRLAPKSKFPAPLEDTNNVLKWLVKNADTYKADLNNVFIVGDSAGAQIASQFGVIYSNPTYASLFDFQIPEEIKLRGLGLNCGRYSLKTDDNRPDKNGLMREYLGRNVVNGDPRLDILENVTKDYPASFIMSAVHDFLLPEAKPMYELLKTKKVKAVYKVYGSEEQTYMSHVFHCNLNLKEASECNREECEFFKRLMVS